MELIIQNSSLSSLNDSWNNVVGDQPLTAHDLKTAFADRWLRIHTLPESKRYPDTEEEYVEILYRHNQILDSEFGIKSPFYLIVPGGDHMRDAIAPAKIDVGDLSLIFWKSEEIDEGERVLEHYYFSSCSWTSGTLDQLLRKVIDEEIYGVILFFTARKILYHPYDGGADLIFETSVKRDAAYIRYANWLPLRADGQ